MRRSSMLTAGCVLAMATMTSVSAYASGVIEEDREDPISYFSSTEVQIHADFNRDLGFEDDNGESLDSDILTFTFAHFSEWKYGDNFGFFDIEGKDGYTIDPALYYGEFATRISFDKIIMGPDNGTEMLGSFLKETYLKLEYNGGAPVDGYDYIDDAFLAGISFDLGLGQPNFGFSNISFLIKDYTLVDEKELSETTWQFTYVWGQPFSIGSVKFSFLGFLDIWEYDNEYVFLTEPQFRLELSSFVGKGNFLSDSAIGVEIEISSKLYDRANSDVLVNPTIFWVTKF